MRPVPFVLVVLVAGASAFDDYLGEVQGRCYSTKKSHLCAKYEFFKYIDDYNIGNVSLTSDSSVKFVSMPSVNVSGVAFEKRDYVEDDSEWMKIVKFFKRRVAKFVEGQGVAVDLPEEVQVVEEARKETGRGKKKKMVIFPILILLKLFKVKILTSLILVGVIFIKKMLLAAAFLLPGVIAAIKHHCKAQQFHVVPYHADDEHYYTHEHQEDDGHDGYEVHGGYGDKHYWDKKKRFSHY